ncbi:MAG: pyroglutamyl-peptidase I [Bacteroidota bacterium]
MDVLITGFNKFGNLSYNPSQLLVEELERRRYSYEGINLNTLVLPTEFKQSEQLLIKALKALNPKVALLLGVAQNTLLPSFERVALNINDTDAPDNCGFCPKGVINKADGKNAYFTKFPIEKIIQKLDDIGIRIAISNHAGTYVCNHVYYIAHYFIEKENMKTLCCFLHIPYLEFDRSFNKKASQLTIIQMTKIMEQIIKQLPRVIDQSPQSL